MGRYERPLKLKTNKIPYLIPGGGMIDRFLGEEGRSTASQMWIASVVQCTLDGSRDSRSYIEEGTEEVCLADEIAREPWLYLGKAFHDKYGSNLGFLLKLLNSRDRLLVQTHPDKERAQKYFGSRFGKTESWYVVDTEPGKEAYIWAGFRQGVTREGFLDLIRKQDTEAILGCLHRFVITPGDVIFIKAGLPHALGRTVWSLRFRSRRILRCGQNVFVRMVRSFRKFHCIPALDTRDCWIALHLSLQIRRRFVSAFF